MQTALQCSLLWRRGALISLLCAVLSLALVAARSDVSAATAGTSGTLSLEAEDYVSSVDAGGALITIVGCSAARGGLAVDGLDVAGDYIEWNLSLAQPFSFRDSLRSAGAIGLVRKYAILFLPAGGGSPVASDTLTTPAGLGVT